ncbi:MAG: cytochrome c biogenesis protein ResB, partial [Cohnella sp.]|nr:cytochrome c biogenesis protein ResB [Cohnella sp.]
TYAGPVAGDETEWVESFKKQLKRRGYRVHQDGTALLAEKNRFSRWGPYINHIGLILFLLAVLGRSVPAWHMDQYLALYEGETRQIPNTNYYLKNDDFTLELYDESELASNQKGKAVPKLFETRATMYECVDACDDPTREPVLKPVEQHPIRVNSPLAYGDLKIYQNSYQARVRFISVNVTLTDTATGKAYGTFELKADKPDRSYEVGPYKLVLNNYFPDFGLDSESRPMSKTRDPNNPAFAFTITGPDLLPDGETYLYFPMPNEESKGYQAILNDYYVKTGQSSGKFAFKVEKAQSGGKMVNVTFSEYTTFLNIRKDKAMPYIWIGAAISMIGLIMGFYWQHRRVWLRIDDGKLSLGAHTNKNSYGLRADVAWALARAGIEVPPKSLDNRRNLR